MFTFSGVVRLMKKFRNVIFLKVNSHGRLRIYAVIFLFFGVAIAGIAVLSSANDVPVSSPNIVVFMTDDQRADTFTEEIMPLTFERLVKQGVLFNNAIANVALCCPSRVNFLTGLYPHRTKITKNTNGAPIFTMSGLDRSTLATWLKGNGYITSLVGKYLNDYTEKAYLRNNLTWPYLPPGWDEEYWLAGGYPGADEMFKPSTVDGDEIFLPKYGGEDMSASHINASINVLNKINGSSPFLLYVSFSAPHTPAVAPAQDIAKFSSLSPHRPPSHNIPWRKGQSPLTSTQIEVLDKFRINQMASLQGVDRAVAAVVDKIENLGLLNQTYFIFTADHGHAWGEHAGKSKGDFFEEGVRIPLAIKGPGIEPRVENSVVSMVDIPVTLADIAGAPVPADLNGASFKTLLHDPNSSWRNFAFLEFGSNYSNGIRTNDYKFIDFPGKTSIDILFDLKNDPYEMVNQIANPDYANVIKQLRALAEAEKKK